MRQLTVTDLAHWLADSARERPVLLDVREPWELATCALPGTLSIPMGQIPARWSEIDTDRPVVCICHHGVRSLQVMRYLAHQGLEDLYNLAGGIDAWAREIDPAMAVY
jgi:rhodanese-related sulfurtransferase